MAMGKTMAGLIWPSLTGTAATRDFVRNAFIWTAKGIIVNEL
jgi:hypothetical protein